MSLDQDHTREVPEALLAALAVATEAKDLGAILEITRAMKPPQKPRAESPLPIFERGDHLEVASAVLARLSSDPELIVHDEGNIHVYDSIRGVWVADDDKAIYEHISSFAGARIAGIARTLQVNDNLVNGATKSMLLQKKRDDFFAGATPGVAFRNGFAEVRDGQIMLSPHAPTHRARWAYDFGYDPTLPHPMLDAHFAAVFADATPEDRQARINTLQEFLGTCLIGRATDYETCLCLIGDGGNGKGQTLEVFRGLFPAGSVAALAPHDWTQRFRLFELVGKLANFVDESPNTEMNGTGTFKKVTSGDPVYVERKNKQGGTVRMVAGHVYNLNETFGTVEHTRAYWRRILVMRFDRNMKDAAENRVRHGKEIVAAERAAIAAWALEGAARLQRQKGRYTEPESSRLAKAEWRKESDSVEFWLSKRTAPLGEDEPGDGLPAQLAYNDYRDYSRDNGLKPVAINKFGKRLKDLAEKRECRDGNYYRLRFLP